MIYLRSLLFNLLFYPWMLIAAATGYGLAKFSTRQALSRWAELWVRGIYFLERHVLGLDHVMQGRSHLPPPPAVLAMQHQSEWETFQMFQWFPDATIVFKKELLNVPFLGTCLRVYGGIPVARSRKPDDLKQFMDSARTVADAKRYIVIFPQGTRTAPAATAEKKLNRGAAALAGDLNIPLVPITLDSGHFWGRRAFFKKPGRITVTIHPPLKTDLPRDAQTAELHRLYTAAASPAGDAARA